MKYLLDSDFLYGLAVENDPHHLICKKIFPKIQKEDTSFIITNLVVQETATVISRKRSQREAKLFISKLSEMPIEILFIGEQDENLVWDLFKKQGKKNTSFIDCANLAIFEKYQFDGILSFDHFYPKSVRITSQ